MQRRIDDYFLQLALLMTRRRASARSGVFINLYPQNSQKLSAIAPNFEGSDYPNHTLRPVFIRGVAILQWPTTQFELFKFSLNALRSAIKAMRAQITNTATWIIFFAS